MVRRGLYAILALAWCTGLIFYSLRRWFQIEGEFGAQAHPWQQSVLSAHGATAFVLLMLLGSMALSHIPIAWRSRRSRLHGLVNAGSFVAMAVTGWCLYYVSHEAAREWVALAHLTIGSILPLILFVHIWQGRLRRSHLRK